MQRGLVHEHPHADPERDVREQAAHVEPSQHEHREDHADRAQRGFPFEGRRVEERDHDDGADVVDDRDREQEEFELGSDSAPEQGDHSQRDRDVGRHRNAPTVAPSSTGIERDIDERGHRHPTERGNHRQRRLARFPELALDELAFDLEAHDEEEHRHQTVVHPLPKRE